MTHTSRISRSIMKVSLMDNGDAVVQRHDDEEYEEVVTQTTRENEKQEAKTILADGKISYRQAVRADINRYHSGPAPVLADNPRAIY